MAKVDADPGSVPWGDESKLFGPPTNVTPDAWWVSITLFWLLLPLNLVFAIVAAFSDGFYRWLAGMAMISCRGGRPLWLAWVWWWYQPAAAIRLIRCGKSRFTFFNASQQLFGGQDWWWHGEGAWGWRYEGVRGTMESDQARGSAFGAVRSMTPEVFPAEGFLLYLDGSRWATVRGTLEEHVFRRSNWEARLPQLPDVLAKVAPKSISAKTLTKAESDRMVSVAIWFMLFGVKLSETQADVIASWGGSGLAGYFIFPRFIQRVAFNLLAKKVIGLRSATLAIFKAHGLEPLAAKINASLPEQYRFPELCGLADSLLYGACFAGVGGTQHGTWAVVQFLLGKTVDVRQDSVRFPPLDTIAPAYKADPERFIMETVRLDCPVTSATCIFKEAQTLSLNTSCCCGGAGPQEVPKDALHQYVLSMANRDKAKWGPNADEFSPQRADLLDLLSWNGALSSRSAAPRICPGQELSMEVMKAITGMLAEVQ